MALCSIPAPEGYGYSFLWNAAFIQDGDYALMNALNFMEGSQAVCIRFRSGVVLYDSKVMLQPVWILAVANFVQDIKAGPRS